VRWRAQTWGYHHMLLFPTAGATYACALGASHAPPAGWSRHADMIRTCRASGQHEILL
jgi:hypothetical protein